MLIPSKASPCLRILGMLNELVTFKQLQPCCPMPRRGVLTLRSVARLREMDIVVKMMVLLSLGFYEECSIVWAVVVVARFRLRRIV